MATDPPLDQSATTEDGSCPADQQLRQLVTRLLPGDSPAVSDLRGRIVHFCANPSARMVFLEGPIGVGKSTVARVVSYGKRIAQLKPAKAQELLDRSLRTVAPGQIDVRLMPWYVEFAATGLVDTLAASQLFGYEKSAFSGADRRRPGIFERAQTGNDGRPQDGAGVTGGVVFLDELADLSLELQQQLLPVLAGQAFYRLGGEGSSDALEYHGCVIAASWRGLGPPQVRADLASRLSATTIRVPDLGERRADLPAIIREIEVHLVRVLEKRLKEEFVIREPELDRAWWLTSSGDLRSSRLQALTAAMLGDLAAVPWARFGNLRALVHALERVVVGRESVDDVVRSLAPIDAQPSGHDTIVEAYLDAIDSIEADGRGLAAHLGTIENHWRVQLRGALASMPARRDRVAERVGIEPSKLDRQLRDIGRIRQGGDE